MVADDIKILACFIFVKLFSVLWSSLQLCVDVTDFLELPWIRGSGDREEMAQDDIVFATPHIDHVLSLAQARQNATTAGTSSTHHSQHRWISKHCK